MKDEHIMWDSDIVVMGGMCKGLDDNHGLYAALAWSETFNDVDIDHKYKTMEVLP